MGTLFNLESSDYKLRACISNNTKCMVKSEDIENGVSIIMDKKDTTKGINRLIMSVSGAKIISSRARNGIKISKEIDINEKTLNINDFDNPGWFPTDLQRIAEVSEDIEIRNPCENFLVYTKNQHDEEKIQFSPYLLKDYSSCLLHHKECSKRTIVIKDNFNICEVAFSDKSKVKNNTKRIDDFSQKCDNIFCENKRKYMSEGGCNICNDCFKDIKNKEEKLYKNYNQIIRYIVSQNI